jgi:hypothetical protein
MTGDNSSEEHILGQASQSNLVDNRHDKRIHKVMEVTVERH